MNRLGLLIVLIATTGLRLIAQPAQQPSFEVASVKVNTSPTATGPYGPQPGGRWLMVNGTISNLIGFGYTPAQATIIGLPAWVDTLRFDVTAKAASPDATLLELRAMVRQLLADRFGFKAHFEEREQATYSLVLVNGNRLGPNLRRVDFDCDVLVEAVSVGRMKLSEIPKASNGALACTSGSVTKTSATGVRVVIQQHGGTRMKGFAESLRSAAGRPVLDKTGLEGFYEYTLEYAGDPLSTNPVTNNAPSYFTALSEQLGLRIVPDRGLVRVLVVDAISRPLMD